MIHSLPPGLLDRRQQIKLFTEIRGQTVLPCGRTFPLPLQPAFPLRLGLRERWNQFVLLPLFSLSDRARKVGLTTHCNASIILQRQF